MSDFLDLHDDPSLRRVLFLGAILLIVVPFVQAGSQLWPLQFSNIQWRFYAAGALSAVLLLPFLGLLLLLVMSRSLESGGMSKTVGVFSGIFAAVLAASFVVFLLDALQLKTIVSTQQEAQFKASALRVAATTVLFVMSFLVLALAGFRSHSRSERTLGGPSRRARGGDSAATADDSPGLIVGR
ncbi:MAG: hypothetical protein K2R93_04945 [Gemmatimonadaceae bacterium]|nr:hypothetical protein [Gemmatimonadaceae bacterium]